MCVKDLNGKSFYLMEVIAFILKNLKDQLVDHLSRTVKPLKAHDFDWVITVPAIWRSRGRHMMREAAYLVSLIHLYIVHAYVFHQEGGGKGGNLPWAHSRAGPNSRATLIFMH